MSESSNSMPKGEREAPLAPPETPFLCPLCQSAIAEDAVFCAYCGKQLKRKRMAFGRRAGYLALVLLMAGAVAIYFTGRQPASPPAAAPDTQRAAPETAPPPEREPAPDAATPVSSEEAAPILRVTAGIVVLNDITGEELARVPAVVVAGGWLALPKRVCLGGYDWYFQMDDGPPIRIEDGILADEGAIGLWRLQADPRPEATALVAWRPDRPIAWLALAGTGESEPVSVETVERGSHFVRVRADRDVFDFGLFVQDETVVGWTFGEMAEDGYLWIGADGARRIADLRVDDFYRISFANSREEAFLRALSPAGAYTDIERLALLAGAFRFDARLDPENLRPELQPDAIADRLRALVKNSVDAGLETEVAAIFDAETLSRAADMNLTADVLRTTAAATGYGSAVTLLQNTLDLMPPAGPAEQDLLQRIQAELYRQWLSSLIQSGDIPAATQAFDDARQRLPEDLNIHLLGVQLYLAQEDWSEAERLLAMKTYPPELSATVAGLQARILDLKAQAGSVVIRFTPGSRQVPVTASLGTGVRQPFIIDTGASMVTIPSETARDLGLIVSVRTPRRTIYTAGGVITAPEVVVPSIAIDDWEVRNVKALVVDLPDNLGWGLLGMNYLRRFRMDLNTDEGLLLLEPR
jgi:clan AA aspartic protease (TIGR02281 family)